MCRQLRIIFVTILKSSFSVWLELSTNQLLKSKLIISEVSTDVQAPWLKQEHVSIFRKQAEGIQLRKKWREKIIQSHQMRENVAYSFTKCPQNKIH